MGDQLSVVESIDRAIQREAALGDDDTDIELWHIELLVCEAREAKALILSLQEQLARASWQPIESAKVSSAIIYDPKWGVSEALRDAYGEWTIAAFNGQIIRCKPTHWMKIPEPPARSTLSPEPLVTQDRGNIDGGG